MGRFSYLQPPAATERPAEVNPNPERAAVTRMSGRRFSHLQPPPRPAATATPPPPSFYDRRVKPVLEHAAVRAPLNILSGVSNLVGAGVEEATSALADTPSRVKLAKYDPNAGVLDQLIDDLAGRTAEVPGAGEQAFRGARQAVELGLETAGVTEHAPSAFDLSRPGAAADTTELMKAADPRVRAAEAVARGVATTGMDLPFDIGTAALLKGAKGVQAAQKAARGARGQDAVARALEELRAAEIADKVSGAAAVPGMAASTIEQGKAALEAREKFGPMSPEALEPFTGALLSGAMTAAAGEDAVRPISPPVTVPAAPPAPARAPSVWNGPSPTAPAAPAAARPATDFLPPTWDEATPAGFDLPAWPEGPRRRKPLPQIWDEAPPVGVTPEGNPAPEQSDADRIVAELIAAGDDPLFTESQRRKNAAELNEIDATMAKGASATTRAQHEAQVRAEQQAAEEEAARSSFDSAAGRRRAMTAVVDELAAPRPVDIAQPATAPPPAELIVPESFGEPRSRQVFEPQSVTQNDPRETYNPEPEGNEAKLPSIQEIIESATAAGVSPQKALVDQLGLSPSKAAKVAKKLAAGVDGPVPGWLESNKKAVAAALAPEARARIEDLSAQRKTAREIAAEIGIDENDVRLARSEMGIPSQAITAPGGTQQPNPDFEAWMQRREPRPTPQVPSAPGAKYALPSFATGRGKAVSSRKGREGSGRDIDLTKIEATPARPAPAESADVVEVAAARVAADPTPAQLEAGNYRKGHVRWNGMDVAIETPRGGVREAADKSWRVEDYPAHYGYVKRTEGKDGDHVDVFMGPDVSSDRVFIIDQIDPKTGKFDEHKAFIGFTRSDTANQVYLHAFNDRSGASRIGGQTEMTADQFKAWLKTGDTKKPVSKLEGRREEAVAVEATEAGAREDGRGEAAVRGGVPEREGDPAVSAADTGRGEQHPGPEPVEVSEAEGERHGGGAAADGGDVQGVRSGDDGGTPRAVPEAVRDRDRGPDRRVSSEKPDVDRRRAERRAQVAKEVGLPEDHAAVTKIVDSEERQSAAEEEAAVDELTGVGSRNAYQKAVKAIDDAVGSYQKNEFRGTTRADAERLARRHGRIPAAVSEVDVAGAGKINTTYGEHYTDAILKATGRALLHLVGDRGQVFRKGGDEFVIHWNDASAAEELHPQITQALRDAEIIVREDGNVVAQYAGVDHYDGFGQDFAAASRQLYAKKPKEKRIPPGLPERIEAGRRGGGSDLPVGEGVRGGEGRAREPEAVDGQRDAVPELRGPGPEDRKTLADAPPEDGGRAAQEGAPAAKRGRGGATDGGGAQRPAAKGSKLRRGVGDRARGVGAAPKRRGSAEPLVRPVDAPRVGHDHRITESDRVGQGGTKEKARANLDAISLLKQIESEGRRATPEEQAKLVRYVGWGGMPQAFDPAAKDWSKVHGELKKGLTDEEFAAARASTTNAHYTAPEVVKGMWSALERLGVKPGLSVLEPAMGTGHFFGLMPEHLLPGSKRVGVELDSVTGRIAKALYPDSDVHVKGFQDVPLPDNAFDVVVSNVPFGNYGVHDPAFKGRPKALTKSIHDYFFAKALDKVRPGGIVAFITSHHTMDKKDSTVRKYLSDRAELVGAIRLPNTAFKANAGTEVTTDVIFLRKLADGEKPSGEGFLKLAEIEGKDGERVPVNEYFERHPEMMLGQMALEGTMYAGKSPALVGEFSPEAMAAAVEALPTDIIQPAAIDSKAFAEHTPVPVTSEIKEHGFGIQDGKLVRREGGGLATLSLPAKTEARVRGMIGVRDAVREVFRTQLTDAGESDIQAARARLNKVYDAYVKANGYLSEYANVRAFADDPDAPLLLSLEKWDPDTETAEKADVFSKRTIERYKPVESVETASEALTVALNEMGRVDWERMESLTGKSQEDLRDELGNLVFHNPEGDVWETADAYLSGNVRAKLKTAEAAAAKDPAFERNAEALRQVQPKDLEPSEIDARLGSSWVPKEDVRDFVADLLNLPTYEVSVAHNAAVAAWALDIGWRTGIVANTETWGTARYGAHELINDALNARTPTVYDPVPGERDKRVVNAQETAAAREQQQKIKDRFRQWLWATPERAARLSRKYNDEFNNVRLREYDGSHLTLPGMARMTLRGGDLAQHQKNAVWRQLQTPTTLLAHVVGAGKTFEMIAASMEMKRLGLAKKPLHVVPNHLVEQAAAEFLRLYPSAHLLVAGKEHFQKGNRQKIMSRIATGNYDAVVVSHKSFEALPVSDETFNRYMKDQIEDLEKHIMSSRKDKASRSVVKELEKAKKRLEKKIEDRAKRADKDKTVSFEELGVDALFVDEAHAYKNLFFPSKMTRVAGLSQKDSSNRAFDMFIKTQYLQKQNGRVTFATGTPITNTMAEMFTMQRFLGGAHLREQGMEHFDAWAQNFGETVTSLELAPDGSGYRMNTRFARFSNIPELVSAFRQFADIQTADMLKLPRPKLAGGRATITAAPSTPQLKAFVESLVKRSEKIRGRRVNPKDDNMLKITGEGRMAALDLRLVDPGAPDLPESKVNRAMQQIYEIWADTKSERSTQIVFSDISTPGGKRFNVYDDIRTKLVERGVPQSEIAFIHDYDTDAAKKALFDKVNTGAVRVLIGSTEKMGVGTNVQRKLIAEHHLDAPWRPADIEQREGRILRQGNEHDEVRIHRYVTEGSFDAYMWQILENKARFINQVMRGDVSVRSAEDLEGSALTYAEVKAIASGNPAVLEKVKVDTEIRRLDALRAHHQNAQVRMQREIVSIPGYINSLEKSIEEVAADIADAETTDTDTMMVRGKVYGEDDRDAGNAALQEALESRRGSDVPEVLGRFADMKVVGRGRQSKQVSPDLYLIGREQYRVETPTYRGLRNALDRLAGKKEMHEKELARQKAQLADYKAEVVKPFEQEAKLQELLKKQAELDASLDLGKNQDEAAGMGADDDADSSESFIDGEAALERLKKRGEDGAYDIGAVVGEGAGVLRDLATYGASLIERGIRAFPEWAERMRRDLGRYVKALGTHLQRIFSAAMVKAKAAGVTFGPLENEPRGVVIGTGGGGLQPHLEKAGKTRQVKEIRPIPPGAAPPAKKTPAERAFGRLFPGQEWVRPGAQIRVKTAAGEKDAIVLNVPDEPATGTQMVGRIAVRLEGGQRAYVRPEEVLGEATRRAPAPQLTEEENVKAQVKGSTHTLKNRDVVPFNLDKMNISPENKALLAKTYAANPDLYERAAGGRRGKMTFGDFKRSGLSLAQTMTPREFHEALAAGAPLADPAAVVYAKNVSDHLAREVYEAHAALRNAVREGKGVFDAERAYLAASLQKANFDLAFKGAQAQAARTLVAFKILAEERGPIETLIRRMFAESC